MSNKIRISEAAKILNVTPQSVRTFILKGLLPQPEQLHARLWLLPESAVLKLKAERELNSK